MRDEEMQTAETHTEETHTANHTLHTQPLMHAHTHHYLQTLFLTHTPLILLSYTPLSYTPLSYTPLSYLHRLSIRIASQHDMLGILLDLDVGSLSFFKNGTQHGEWAINRLG
jgi:hypothetical protein